MQLRGARAVIRIILLILMVYSFLTFLSVRQRLAEAQEALAGTRRAAEMLQRQNQALQSSIDSETEEEIMERLARDRLRLVRPEETETYQMGD